ncbi:MAG: biotin synthase BioB [Chlamydiales bacterium]|nr:biotin synthase BioB [Chlamydiales bacterium]
MDIESIRAIHNMPLLDLVVRANAVLREHHTNGVVQCCQIFNVKTGGCSEDCSYCAQSSRYTTHVTPKPLMRVADVLEQAKESKAAGVTRICLSAAWREAKQSGALDKILEMVKGIKALGIEPCCTLGMLEDEHIAELKEAGVYAVNHNIDTSEEYYPKVITTRTFGDRLDTVARVREAGISVCCGGIIGMGESLDDRLSMLRTLASMDPQPESVPINLLVPIPGTPFGDKASATSWELLRMIATARILMPKAMVRLSGGRMKLSISQQALCFLAGANSIHVGPKLLTTPNFEHHIDQDMFKILGLTPQEAYTKTTKPAYVPPVGIEEHMQEALAKRQQEGTLRRLRITEELIDLTSNDYLGFARSPQLLHSIDHEFKTLIQDGSIRPHVGATGSRLLTGNSHYAEALEQHIADFHGAEAGILFNSGYTANIGLLSAIMNKEDTVVLDTQVHASTWEGTKVSGARQLLFKHNDVSHLESQLKKATGRIFVCVEALYSMTGDIAPLEAICDVCEKFGAHLIVDEAHSTGLFGKGGRGIVSAHGLEKRIFARIHTFGKALGTHGAIVLGSHTLRSYQINFSRPFIYSTAFPLHTLVSIRCAYDLMEKSDEARQKLQTLIHAFKSRVAASSLPISVGPTPIQSIKISGVENVRLLSRTLAECGLDVRPIMNPTVRRGEECLRVCLHAFNSVAHLDQLIEVLSRESEQVFIA